MKQKSYFKKQVKQLEKKQFKYFKTHELKSLTSITEQYINAVEDNKLKDRYVAPLTHGVYVQLKRILGN